jgi:hypothetical protein
MTDLIVEAVSYRTLAAYYKSSAELLEEKLPAEIKSVGDIMSWIPFYFLISHSAELFLKCALFKRGMDPKKLRKLENRHNLSGLLKLIEKKMVPISVELRDAITALSGQHSNHGLRYVSLEKNYYPTHGMPKPKDLYKALDELLLGRISTHDI